MDDRLIVTLTVGELKQLIIESVQEARASSSLKIPEDVLLKRKEVAELLQISLVTLHDWKKKGLLPFHRIRSRIYFKKSEVMELLSKPIYIGRYGKKK